MPRKTRKQLIGKTAENADDLEREIFYRYLRQDIRARKNRRRQQCQADSTEFVAPIESNPTDFYVNFPLAFSERLGRRSVISLWKTQLSLLCIVGNN